jgi:mono/diheme cytochrome c family protein
MVVEASWQQQCAACHGPIGHGDGPTGAMLHAADLTQASWQETVTDAQIADVIAHGKGKMPPFDLPPKVVAGLVARIRASRGH